MSMSIIMYRAARIDRVSYRLQLFIYIIFERNLQPKQKKSPSGLESGEMNVHFLRIELIFLRHHLWYYDAEGPTKTMAREGCACGCMSAMI